MSNSHEDVADTHTHTVGERYRNSGKKVMMFVISSIIVRVMTSHFTSYLIWFHVPLLISGYCSVYLPLFAGLLHTQTNNYPVSRLQIQLRNDEELYVSKEPNKRSDNLYTKCSYISNGGRGWMDK